ncbi:hypothetical protein AMK26_22220 [Streptomyces sp. CB03234]|nr:hypothetical protein AMK26_22220 [Streptomyces sp. CB03234]
MWSSGIPFRDREEGTELAVQSDRFVSRQDQRDSRGLRGPLVQVEGHRETAGLRRRDLSLTGKAEMALDGR